MPDEERPPQRLYMVRFELDAARVVRYGMREEVPARHEDLGHLLHCFLAALFGKDKVQPFRLLSERCRQLPVLGYAQSTPDELRRHAQEFADPERYAAITWERFDAKPMPLEWKPGRRLGFEVRVCPVVRLASDTDVALKNGSKCRFRAGAELDAWEHRCFLASDRGPRVSRDETYSEWLRLRLATAAALDSARLRSFRRIRLLRRDHGAPRNARLLERPDAIIEGELSVSDSYAFNSLLATGVGRHRAFGFGMLLLRPPGWS